MQHHCPLLLQYHHHHNHHHFSPLFPSSPSFPYSTSIAVTKGTLKTSEGCSVPVWGGSMEIDWRMSQGNGAWLTF